MAHHSKDYYAILNIENPETVDEHEIKQSYKRLSLQTHPDKNLNDPNATVRFQEIKEAYDTLIDPQKRRIYNISRKKADTAGADTAGADTAETSHASAEDSDRYTWWFFRFINKNKGPKFFTDGHKPYSTRPQRAGDRERASEQWNREAQQSRTETADAREAMREAQREANDRLAREKAETQRRAEEEELRARKNMEGQPRNGTKGKSGGRGKRQIFRNLPGSNCWHRTRWNKEHGEGLCQACGRVMDAYVYRCEGCSMSACRICMAIVKK